jgi:hypothetical protein
MLSEALQRNAKHEARLSNSSELLPSESGQKRPEILRFAQNDIVKWVVLTLCTSQMQASLRALLSHSIDYAGMFPPCSLALEPALQNHARYVDSHEAWMLNAFIVPVQQFDSARELLSNFDPLHPLRIAALGPKTANTKAFLEALQDVDSAIRSFSKYDVDLVSIAQLEMLLPDDVELACLKEAKAIVGDLPVFWEAPPDKAERTIGLLGKHNSDQDVATFGCKLRTGGITADAFPTAAQIARALVTPATHQLPIKFTAGLHHPIRQFRAEVQTKMHGFLNVFGAAVLAAEHEWDANQALMMLEDEDPRSFSFTGDFFAWREWKIDVERLRDRRRFVVSFGSCSFDEPGDDLRSLRLL